MKFKKLWPGSTPEIVWNTAHREAYHTGFAIVFLIQSGDDCSFSRSAPTNYNSRVKPPSYWDLYRDLLLR